jgi:hypothetical protein
VDGLKSSAAIRIASSGTAANKNCRRTLENITESKALVSTADEEILQNRAVSRREFPSPVTAVRSALALIPPEKGLRQFPVQPHAKTLMHAGLIDALKRFEPETQSGRIRDLPDLGRENRRNPTASKDRLGRIFAAACEPEFQLAPRTQLFLYHPETQFAFLFDRLILVNLYSTPTEMAKFTSYCL